MEKKTGIINRKYKEFISESSDIVDENSLAYEERLKVLVDMALPLMKKIEEIYPLVKRYRKANEFQRLVTISWMKCFKKRIISPPSPPHVASPSNDPKIVEEELKINRYYIYRPIKGWNYNGGIMRHDGDIVLLTEINRNRKDPRTCDSVNTSGNDYLIRFSNNIMGMTLSYFYLWTKKECLKPYKKKKDPWYF